MSNRTGLLLAAVVGAVIAAASVIWPEPVARAPVATLGVPVVMRTPGGLLEVATLDTVERFERRDSKALFGIPLGETVSEIRAPVRYRYHVELAKDWPISVNGSAATVRAPALEPSLPIAFDTARMEKQTRNGWARFNRNESLAEVERTLSPALAQRAQAPETLRLVREEARRTIAEFVTKWLLEQRGGPRDTRWSVTVLFPDEPEPGAVRPVGSQH